MQANATIDQIIKFVEQNGVLVEKDRHGFLTTGVDMVLPHINLLLCLRGSSRVMIDMQEYVVEKNDLGITHIVFRRFRLCTRLYLGRDVERAEYTCLQS